MWAERMCLSRTDWNVVQQMRGFVSISQSQISAARTHTKAVNHTLMRQACCCTYNVYLDISIAYSTLGRDGGVAQSPLTAHFLLAHFVLFFLLHNEHGSRVEAFPIISVSKCSWTYYIIYDVHVHIKMSYVGTIQCNIIIVNCIWISIVHL